MKKLLYLVLIAVMAVVAGSVKATPLSGSGTETDPYIIATTADWTEFCDNHATYKSSYIKMAGFVTAEANKYFNDTFNGTFDGDGYTLTVNINVSGRVAPFMRVSNAIIKNLRVAGSITGSANHSSGLVSYCTNGTTCTIQNCIVSATITNNGNLGGFIGHANQATVNLTDCVFNGTLNYSGANNNYYSSNGTNSAKKVGGFVAWEENNCTINISRCLFDGTINCTAGFTPFIVRWSKTNFNVNGDAASCLYTVAKSAGFPSGMTIFDGTSAIGQTANQIVTTMNNAGGNGWRVFKGKAEPSMQTPCTLGNIPDGWTITASGASVPVTNGDAIIAAGATVVLSPPDVNRVKRVTLKDPIINLDTVEHNLTVPDGWILTGTLAANVKVSIADGATVTLDNASISYSGNGADYAGLTLLGDGTIQLADGTTNTMIGGLDGDGNSNWPGIYVPEGKTLTINGNTGVLNASRGGNDTDYGSATGIGCGWNDNCGNIVINGGVINATGGGKAAGIGGCFRRNFSSITINGGTVTATGGYSGAGIGTGGNRTGSTTQISPAPVCGNITITSGTVIAIAGEGAAGIGTGRAEGYGSSNPVHNTVGNITISGGTVTATGGKYAAAIGNGYTATAYSTNTCGAITITDGVTLITATHGSNATYSIGRGNNPNGGSNTCGTITIGGTVYPNDATPNQTDGLTFVYPVPVPVFSVSATKTVVFAPGNLQYKSGEGWRFAEHQYDYIGAWDATDWVDYFGWGTWGEGKDPLLTSTDNADYEWSTDFQGTLNGHNDWYTLSNDEWIYLFQIRTNASSLYGTGTVNGVNGVIILPDGSELSINTSHNSWSNNTIDAATWNSIYEAEGAVFLPGAGRRSGTGVGYIGAGVYWSSTPQSSDSQRAHDILFNNGTLSVGDVSRRFFGYSVRLVKDVQ